jgi:hypothetical protein
VSEIDATARSDENVAFAEQFVAEIGPRDKKSPRTSRASV